MVHILLMATCLAVLNASFCLAFSPNYSHQSNQRYRIAVEDFGAPSSVVVFAGGFEWEDPTESFDQGVDNPFKNPDLISSEDGLKIDPARLLGPRLNGANLYFVGMMGCGKTAVGDIVARRESREAFSLFRLMVHSAKDMT